MRLPRGRGAAVAAVGLGALAVAVVLAAVRVGEEPGALSGWQAIVLGLTQGATEFLPISSSGHLVLVPWPFLLLVPITTGAIVYKAVKHFDNLPSGWAGPFLIGVIASSAAGILAIHGLLSLLQRRDYTPFVVYRLAVVVAIVVLIAAGVRESTF